MNIKFLNFRQIDYYIICIIFLTFLGCLFFMPNSSAVIDDVGRELYFPSLVLENKILYKDIFNLFGPFAYLFNALLYKMFGANVTTFYVLGFFTSNAVTVGIYLLSRQFFDKKTSFMLSLVAIFIGVCTTIDFNYNFLSYTYAVLYGFISFIYSSYFYIKYSKDNKAFDLYLSVFFAGIAVCSKYEYLLYALILFINIIKPIYKDIKILLKLILTFLFPIITCFTVLIIQGLTLNDFLSFMSIISKLVKTESYKYYYSHHVGTFLSSRFVSQILLSAKTFLLFFILFEFAKKMGCKNIILGILLTYFAYNCISPAIDFAQILSSIAPITCLILLISKFKALTKQELFMSVSAILISLKVFWQCNMSYYGIYFLPVILIALLVLLKEYKELLVTVKVYIISAAIVVLCKNIQASDILYYPLYSHNDSQVQINAPFKESWRINALVKYIRKNSTKDEKVVVYPEGLIVNYLAERPTEGMYYSLQPPYLEAFGEDNVIKYFQANKPKFFVLRNTDMFVYNKKHICETYAFVFCNFVEQNYELVQKIQYPEDKNVFKVYKRID